MGQQHSQFLAAERLYMHRTVQSHPDHLSDAARVIAVGLVDLRLQHRLHVPRLDTDHWQACFRKPTEKPLRQRPGFQSDPFEAVGGAPQKLQKGDRVTIYLPMIPEAAYAMLACARIGAIHSVVFAGFSPDSLAQRITDCQSKIVITADEGLDRKSTRL